jgi:hypothetical protein
MLRIIRIMAAAVAAAAVVSSANADMPDAVSVPASEQRAGDLILVRGTTTFSTRSFSGGRSFSRGFSGGRSFNRGGGIHRGGGVSRSRSFPQSRGSFRPRSAPRGNYTRHSVSRPRHVGGHISGAPHHMSRGGAGSLGRGQRFNANAQVTRARVGSVSHSTFNGHRLSHKVVGDRHRSLVGHNFKRPGNHLRDRVGHLRSHRWHQRFKHVVIIGFGGVIACELYCEFDVPLDVYGDFVAAAGEAPADDGPDCNADKDAAANVSPEEQARRRAAQCHGWNKAVAILERSAAEDNKKSNTGEAVFAQPDEQVDMVLDGSGEAKN